MLDRGAGGQHDHRQLGHPHADRAEDLQPVLAGERQIEEDEGVVAGQSSRLAALTVVADGDGVPLGVQALLDEARERALVFDYQDPHLGSPLYALHQARSGR